MNATLPLRRTVIACAVAMGVIGFGETLLYELPDALGKDPSFAGILIAVQGIGAIAGALTATRVMARKGEVKLTGAGMTILAIGAIATADQALPVVLAGKILYGVGLPWMVIGAFTLLAARHAAAPPGPHVRRRRARDRRAPDGVDRARRRAGRGDRLPRC